MTIIIDPYMIAIPTGEEVDADAVRDYATRLKQWEAVLSQPQRYAVVNAAINEIYALNLQPNRQNLRALFDKHGVDEYSAEDFLPLTSGLLSSKRPLEEIAGMYDTDIWCEIDHVPDTEKVIPDEIRERMPESVAQAFVQALIYCGYCFDRQGDSNNWSIATAPLDADRPIPALLLECDIERMAENDELSIERLSRRWPLLYAPEHLYATYDPVDYYEKSPATATYITWCQMKASGKPVSGISDIKFRFGDRFVASLLEPSIQRRNDFRKDIVRVFEAIIHVLEDLWPYNSDKHHALRERILERQSPQQTRIYTDQQGNDYVEKAARVEVKAGTDPLHLHYWQCYDGSYEFANITDDHDDPTIR